MQQPRGQTWNGGAPISNGGPGTTDPPAGDGPALWSTVDLSLVINVEHFVASAVRVFFAFFRIQTATKVRPYT